MTKQTLDYIAALPETTTTGGPMVILGAATLRALLTEREALLAALAPFAQCSPSRVGSIPPAEIWLWRPFHNQRQLSGINVQHIIDAQAAIALANGTVNH